MLLVLEEEERQSATPRHEVVGHAGVAAHLLDREGVRRARRLADAQSDEPVRPVRRTLLVAPARRLDVERMREDGHGGGLAAVEANLLHLHAVGHHRPAAPAFRRDVDRLELLTTECYGRPPRRHRELFILLGQLIRGARADHVLPTQRVARVLPVGIHVVPRLASLALALLEVDRFVRLARHDPLVEVGDDDDEAVRAPVFVREGHERVLGVRAAVGEDVLQIGLDETLKDQTPFVPELAVVVLDHLHDHVLVPRRIAKARDGQQALARVRLYLEFF